MSSINFQGHIIRLYGNRTYLNQSSAKLLLFKKLGGR